jgi:hypothetical protein
MLLDNVFGRASKFRSSRPYLNVSQIVRQGHVIPFIAINAKGLGYSHNIASLSSIQVNEFLKGE